MIQIGGLIIALFVGFLTGVFGVGGGFLMTPALVIILGTTPTTAVAVGLAVIFVSSSFGMFSRRGSGTVDFKLALILAIGSIPGVLIGTGILELLEDMKKMVINGREVVVANYVLMCGFIVLLTWIVWFMFFDYRRNQGKASPKSPGLLSGLKLGPRIKFDSLEGAGMPVIALVVFGLAAGILTGLMGIGGGIIIVPILIYIVGLPAVKATGTSLMLVWVSSLTAVIQNSGTGSIDYHLLAAMLIGGVIGTFFGTKAGLKLSEAKLKLYFAFVLITAILLIGLKVVQMTFGNVNPP